MYSLNLEENTINDLSTITEAIKKSFSDREIYIEAEMQSEVQLWVKLTSDRSLDTQKSMSIILKSLNDIEIYPIIHVIISGFSANNCKDSVWSGYLNLKSNKFVDDTEKIEKGKRISIASLFQSNRTIPLICKIVSLGVIMTTFLPKSRPTEFSAKPITTMASPALPPLLMGKSDSGYELWLQSNCIHVKKATNANLGRFNTDPSRLKSAIRKDTGVTCVIFD